MADRKKRKKQPPPDDMPEVDVLNDEELAGLMEAEYPSDLPDDAPAPETLALPILPVREAVLFPYTISSLTIESQRSSRLVRDVVQRERLVVLMPVVSDAPDPRKKDDFFSYGCVARIVKMLRFPDDTLRILVRGLQRARLERVVRVRPYLKGDVAGLVPEPDDSIETEALARSAINQFQEVIALSPTLPDDLRVALLNVEDWSRLADLIADSLSLKFEEKLELLRLIDVRPRLELLASLLAREALVLRLGSEIQTQVTSTFAKAQREHFLREQLKAVQEQLGQEAETPELAELRKRVAGAKLPADAHEAATRELDRLRHMHPSAADYNVSRTYIDWLVTLPWGVDKGRSLELNRARKILDRDHHDLAKVKERILEYLAVLKLKGPGDLKAPILCFVGPPGVGKTSLGQSIARALGREFVRLSLGGVHDEAEIRGHRRTYVGALPGRVIQGIRRAKSANPVFMLDEVDKLGKDFRGDPASALLEVLDPQQNSTFSDHYLEVPFDLSRVLFITTANLSDTIPPALLDRMEVIRLPGYTHEEKRAIAKRYLVPRQLDANGLSKQQLRFQDSALDAIVRLYTSEAGVRNLEREIGTVCRKMARRLVEGDVPESSRTTLTADDLAQYLGPQKQFPDVALEKAQVGVATGLAWTATGGEILHVEVAAVPGKGNLTLTGSLGDVMKESAQIAYSFVRSRYADLGIDAERAGALDFHVHVPAGATPKDGPSAGITLAAALASLLTGRPVLPSRAMTGELSLRGHVLPVGGVKEKVLAASRAGITDVILPDKNRFDLDELPEDVRKRVAFHLVSDAMDALRLVLAAKE